jgi:AcrR family transcriptional regulator
LQAALRVVGREGLPAASLGAIAREAGTSKPAVLYHFGSREKLLHHMASRALEHVQVVLLEIAREAERSARTQITLDSAFSNSNREMLSAARELMALGGRDKVVSDLVHRMFDDVERTVADLLPGPVGDARQIAGDIVRSVNGFLPLWLSHEGADPGPFQAGALRVSLQLGAAGLR